METTRASYQLSLSTRLHSIGAMQRPFPSRITILCPHFPEQPSLSEGSAIDCLQDTKLPNTPSLRTRACIMRIVLRSPSQ